MRTRRRGPSQRLPRSVSSEFCARVDPILPLALLRNVDHPKPCPTIVASGPLGRATGRLLLPHRRRSARSRNGLSLPETATAGVRDAVVVTWSALGGYPPSGSWSSQPRTWVAEGRWRAWSGGQVVDTFAQVIDEHVAAEAREHESTPAALGCVPWLTHAGIAARLARLPACCVVVDKGQRWVGLGVGGSDQRVPAGPALGCAAAPKGRRQAGRPRPL